MLHVPRKSQITFVVMAFVIRIRQTYPDLTHFILVLCWRSSALLSVESQASVRWDISGNEEMVPC